MLLSKLTACSDAIRRTGADVEIAGLTEDSRKVQPGFLFIATPGTRQDGGAFIDDAINKGAAAVLAAPGVTSAVPMLTAPDIRRATSALAAAFYPRQPETIAAVTGTSGKTSTAQFAREIWQTLKQPSASIGTLGLVTASGAEYGSLTTPDAINLHRLLDSCAGRDVTHVALEASSHGIELRRLDNVRLKAGGFTNLSRDHLDYHKTMEAYLEAKLGLFTRLLPPGAAAVLNQDIPQFTVLSTAARERGLTIIGYGKQGGELRLLETEVLPNGQLLHIEAFGTRIEAMLPLIGGFQAINALCAAGLVIGCGAQPGETLTALARLTGVPGRLQYIGASARGGAVFVDYAHKPDALENVLRALRPHAAAHGAKLGVLFGCGGNRDRGKRPLMGRIASELADWVIVSDDNPRHEEASAIRAEILAGCADKKNVGEIGDRAKAIAEAVGKLGKSDILIIAGKGHEPGQIVGDSVLPFDDAEQARKVMNL